VALAPSQEVVWVPHEGLV